MNPPFLANEKLTIHKFSKLGSKVEGIGAHERFPGSRAGLPADR